LKPKPNQLPPSQNPNEHHRFGDQTQNRIGLEFKQSTLDPSPINGSFHQHFLPSKP
jgi:hypothetical protein